MPKPLDGYKPPRKGRRNDIDNIHFITSPFYRPTWGDIVKQGPAPRARAHRGASVDDFLDFIYIGLKTYQAYWTHYGENEFMVYFPFALRLDKGDKVFNIRQGCNLDGNNIIEYTIKSVSRTNENVVILDGAQAPRAGDLLQLDESSDRIVNFHIGYPNSESTTQYFTQEQLEDSTSEPWLDTITYRILRTEPAGTRDMFQGRREFAPRHMETQYEDMQDRNIEYRVQSFDSEVQFDCWAMTNERAEDLASWFKHFMDLYVPIFTENGIIKVLFFGKLEDIHITRWRSDIIGRSLRYRLRTQEVTAHDVGIMHSIRSSFQAGLDGNFEQLEFIMDDLPTPSNEIEGIII